MRTHIDSSKYRSIFCLVPWSKGLPLLRNRLIMYSNCNKYLGQKCDSLKMTWSQVNTIRSVGYLVERNLWIFTFHGTEEWAERLQV